MTFVSTSGEWFLTTKQILPKANIPWVKSLRKKILSSLFLITLPTGSLVYYYYEQKSHENFELDQFKFAQIKSNFGAINVSKMQQLSTQDFKNIIFNSIPADLHSKVAPILPIVLEMSSKYKVDPFWILSVMWTESHFDSQAKSHKGAIGLMQILPTTAQYLSKKLIQKKLLNIISGPLRDPDIEIANYADVYDVRTNIELGVFYLKLLQKNFRGSSKLATISYNMGQGTIQKMLKAGIPVGAQNQYWNKVLTNYSFFHTEVERLGESINLAYQQQQNWIDLFTNRRTERYGALASIYSVLSGRDSRLVITYAN